MKIELFLVPKDDEGIKIKEFLIENDIKFKEIITDNIDLLEKVARTKLFRKISLIKVTYSSSIGVIVGFNELALSQLIEHIKKYKPKIIYKLK